MVPIQGQHSLSLRERTRRYFPLFICLGVPALGLQIGGLATKGWLIMKFLGIKIYAGLWTVRACATLRNYSNCVDFSYDKMKELTKGAWDYGFEKFRVETCLALALLVIALAVLVSCTKCTCKPGQVKCGVCCVFVTALISGILALVASGEFGDDVRKADDALKQLPEENRDQVSIDVPYSLILTGVGGLLAIILAFLLLFVLKPWKRDEPESPPAYSMHQSPNTIVVSYPPQHMPSAPVQNMPWQPAQYPTSQPVQYPRKPSGAYTVPYSGP